MLDAVGATRVSLLGTSEGGPAATMLAAAHPDRIAAMVQYATYPRISWALDYPEGFRSNRYALSGGGCARTGVIPAASTCGHRVSATIQKYGTGGRECFALG